MKHVKRITLRKAEDSGDDLGLTAGDISGLLDQVFGFVLNLTADKGKGGQNGAS